MRFFSVKTTNKKNHKKLVAENQSDHFYGMLLDKRIVDFYERGVFE